MNLELYKNPIVPSKFKKIEKLANIAATKQFFEMRIPRRNWAEVNVWHWSNVEGNQEVEYFELVPVPYQVPDLVEVSRPHTQSKKQIQTRITSFLLAKNTKMIELTLLFSDFFGRL